MNSSFPGLYHLNRLAQKAYPDRKLNQLQVHVIDQFITGLNDYELQKHVQFGHTKSLNEAIGLATKYESLEGSTDRIKKPKVEIENNAPIVSQTKASQPAENLTVEQIDRLIEKKLNLLSVNTKPRSKSPTPNPTSEQRETTSATKTSSTSKHTFKPETYCTCCTRNNHTIEDCRTRRYHERRRAERQINQQSHDASYVITIQPEPGTKSRIDQKSSSGIVKVNEKDNPAHTPKTHSQIDLSSNNMSAAQVQNKQVHRSVITNQIYEVKSNTTRAACLYLNTSIFKTQLLLDTGSPCSILSLGCFER